MRILKNESVIPNYDNARTLVARNRVDEANDFVDNVKELYNLPIVKKYEQKEAKGKDSTLNKILNMIPSLTLLILSFLFASSFGLATAVVNVILCAKGIKAEKSWIKLYYQINLLCTVILLLFIVTAYILLFTGRMMY